MNTASRKNKIVVVTGCSTGIGRAAVTALVKRGYRVIGTFRKQEDADACRRHLACSENLNCLIIDLADSNSVEKAANEIIERTAGNIFALFNNAAYGQPGAVEDLSREALRKQFEVNLFGTHQLTRVLLPYMLKQEDARIVQNSSILGFIGMPMRGAYVASKFALEGLTDTMRIELMDTNIKVVLIEPGPILSRFRANALEALRQNIDFGASRHGWRYENALVRLSKEGATSRHTLGPEAVVEKLLHALESKRPRHRYYVTRPTYVMALLTRILPSSVIDKLLLKAAKAE